MKIIRRLYFYAITIISLEAAVWGTINLLRTTFDLAFEQGWAALGGLDFSLRLAGSLSLVAVGLPVFLIHWPVTQRDARRDPEERSARLRTLFLYGAMTATLLPAVHNTMAIANRLAGTLLGVSPSLVAFGGSQTLPNNLAAILINLVAWVYFFRVAGRDWQANPNGETLAETRRLYRAIWLVYGLGFSIAGVQQILNYLFLLPGDVLLSSPSLLANGAAFTIVGAPVWVWTWRGMHLVSDEPDEKHSNLNLALFYTITLAAAATTWISLAVIAYGMFNWLLGEAQTLADFLNQNGGTLAIAIPMGVVWRYYLGPLRRRVEAEADQPRRAGLERVYDYFLTLLGKLILFTGCEMLLLFVVERVGGDLPSMANLRGLLSCGFACLLVGLPLWLSFWRCVQTDALQTGDAGDHARRSVLRKTYLYLLVFGLVVGCMVSGGMLIYRLITTLLGSETEMVVYDLLIRAQVLLLCAAWLGYNLKTLAQDGRRSQQALGELHEKFACVLFAGEGDPMAAAVQNALQREAPRLPLTVLAPEMPTLAEKAGPANAAVLSAALAIDPPPALRTWLAGFSGERIILPAEQPGWHWLGAQRQNPNDLGRTCAHTLRLLAEKQSLRSPAGTNPWAIAGFILLGLFGLQLLAMVFFGIAAAVGFD